MLVNEAALFEIIQDTWISTLGFQVDLATSPEFSPIEAFTVCVKITGAWDGEVRLHCPLQLARLIAAAIFQEKPDHAGSDEILDALSELIHIIGGNLKALLPQPVTLSFPSLLDPTNWAQTTPQWQLVCRLTLISEGHLFVVTLLGGLCSGANAETPTACESQWPA